MDKQYKARFKKDQWTPVAVAGESIDGRSISREFLENIVKSYNPSENGIKAKIKIGHDSPEGVESKSYGYFSHVRMSEKNPNVMEAKPEWVHDELTEKLESGEYHDISPEFRPIIKKTGESDTDGKPLYSYEYYFSGVAVLGASHPAFPILSADSIPVVPKDIALPHIMYKAKDIVIEQKTDVSSENAYYDKCNNDNDNNNELKQTASFDSNNANENDAIINTENITLEVLREKYETLKKEYDFVQKENKTHNERLNKYSNTINDLKTKLAQMKTEEKSKKIATFLQEALTNGKIDAYELMREHPNEDIKDSKLFKHLYTLSEEQLQFEMDRINQRKSNKIFKQIVNPEQKEYNKYKTHNDHEVEDLEEKKFINFCIDNNYNFDNVNDVDRAYKEWRKYVKH